MTPRAPQSPQTYTQVRARRGVKSSLRISMDAWRLGALTSLSPFLVCNRRFMNARMEESATDEELNQIRAAFRERLDAAVESIGEDFSELRSEMLGASTLWIGASRR